MPNLSLSQIKQYKDEGFVAPIDVLTLEEANKVREELEYIEKKWPNELEGLGRNYVHVISPIFDKVVHNLSLIHI